MGLGLNAGNRLINLLLRGSSWPPPTRNWISLHTGDPGKIGAHEVQPGAWPTYARVDPALGEAMSTGFGLSTAGETANLKPLPLPAMNGTDPLVISHFGLWDTVVGGLFLLGDPLKEPITLFPTDEFLIPVGSLVVEVP